MNCMKWVTGLSNYLEQLAETHTHFQFCSIRERRAGLCDGEGERAYTGSAPQFSF